MKQLENIESKKERPESCSNFQRTGKKSNDHPFSKNELSRSMWMR